MKLPDFDRLDRDGEACPSTLQLERLVAERDPDADRLAKVRSHVEGCASCETRLEKLRAGFDATPDFDVERMLAGVHRSLEAPKPGVSERLLDWLRENFRLAIPAAVAFAALALVIAPALRGPLPEPGAEPGVSRVKGTLALHVFRMRDAEVTAAVSGDVFTPGDALRFVVDLPGPGEIRIFGVDAAGELYTAWPQPEHAALSAREGGREQKLPGAVELDDAPGSEQLYLVHCPADAEPPSCRSEGADKAPRCTEGCAMTRFVLNKEPQKKSK